MISKLNSAIIAVDAMGGDIGVAVTVPAALLTLKRHTNLRLILVGDTDSIRAEIAKHPHHEVKDIDSRLIIHHASQKVEMDESPAKALRSKKDSSMRVAANLVSEGKAMGMVSAGNTGALVATAHFVFKGLPGIDRPAIIATLPTLKSGKGVRVLDLGANVDSTAKHLYQFAVMGSVLSEAVDNIHRPRIGLLNIGSEEIKGNDQVKQAAKLISENKNINYVGFVEGDAIFKGEVDVVVCDGFVGNVFLKSIEGVAKMVAFYVKRAFFKNLFTKLVALLARGILRDVAKQVDPEKFNGASLLGLKNIVVKSHGGANVNAFVSAIQEAMVEVEKNVPQLIGETVGNLLNSR